MCQSELTEFFFSQNSPSLPQNSVRLSELSSPKQYSRNSIPPVFLRLNEGGNKRKEGRKEREREREGSRESSRDATKGKNLQEF